MWVAAPLCCNLVEEEERNCSTYNTHAEQWKPKYETSQALFAPDETKTQNFFSQTAIHGREQELKHKSNTHMTAEDVENGCRQRKR